MRVAGTSGWSGSTWVTETSGRPMSRTFWSKTVQRGLVDYRAVDEGGAVALVGEAEPVKPGGPSGVEVPLEPDFVAARSRAGGRSMGRSWCSFRCCLAGWISDGIADIR